MCVCDKQKLFGIFFSCTVKNRLSVMPNNSRVAARDYVDPF